MRCVALVKAFHKWPVYVSPPLRRQVTVPAIGCVRIPLSLSCSSVLYYVCVCLRTPVVFVSRVVRVSPTDLVISDACKNACCFTFSISPLGDPSVGGRTHALLLLLPLFFSNHYIYKYYSILTIKGRCGAPSQNRSNMVRRRRRFGAPPPPAERHLCVFVSAHLPP